MSKPKLIVFIGKPGSGKTTLIKKVYPGCHIVDVLPFVLAYEIDGALPEDRNLDGYKDMYKHLMELDKEKIILELGTNHPEYNVEQLKSLQEKYQVIILLCEASIETCRQRINSREREMDPETVERRLQRDFPNLYLQLLKGTSLPYVVVDMEKSLDDNVNFVSSKI